MRDLLRYFLIGVGIATVTTIPLLVGLFYYLLPYSNWVDYKAVIPTQEAFNIGERPEFVSVREVKRQVYVEWHDKLRCKPVDSKEYILLGYAEDYASLDVVPERTTNPWKLQIAIDKLPTQPSECFLEANIIIPAPFEFLRKALDKQQRINSQTFFYK